MKNLLIAIIVFSCFLAGCSKHCGFSYKTNETPALKKNDYNSCAAIYQNFAYTVCNGNDYPYWVNTGDTIMICGYFSEKWSGHRDMFTLFDSPNNAGERNNCIKVFNASFVLPDEIDISKKCYIIPDGLRDFIHNYASAIFYASNEGRNLNEHSGWNLLRPAGAHRLFAKFALFADKPEINSRRFVLVARDGHGRTGIPAEGYEKMKVRRLEG